MNDNFYVFSMNKYRDGGTVEIRTTDGVYSIDRSIDSKTPGELSLALAGRRAEVTVFKESEKQDIYEKLVMGFLNSIMPKENEAL